MAIETDSFRFILAIFGINILHYMIRKDKAKVHWGQVLFFAFTHTNAIYTNALHRELHRGRPRSFYKWAGGAWQSCAEDRRCLCRFHPYREIFMRLIEIFEASKKQDLTPLTTLYGENRISGDAMKDFLLKRRIVHVGNK